MHGRKEAHRYSGKAAQKQMSGVQPSWGTGSPARFVFKKILPKFDFAEAGLGRHVSGRSCHDPDTGFELSCLLGLTNFRSYTMFVFEWLDR